MDNILESVKKNYRWLIGNTIKINDGLGVIDPIKKTIVDHHYATSHLFLSSCALWKITKDPYYLQQADSALNYCLDRVSIWIQDRRNHWEFNNYAMLEGAILLGDSTKISSISRLFRELESLPHHRMPYATNWKILLAAFLWRKASIKLSIKSAIMCNLYKIMSLISIDQNGCIYDVQCKSNSTQYHSFSTALLLRWAVASQDRNLLVRALQAIEYLATFVTPNGEVVYRGRGQMQIFGQAAAYYCFAVAAIIDKYNKNRWSDMAECISNYAIRLQTKEGIYPLVLRAGGEKPGPGWYDYNYLSVYNAFASAWFSLAIHEGYLNNENVNHNKIDHKNARKRILINNNPFSVCLKNYYSMVVVSSQGAKKDYLSECGFSLDLLWTKSTGILFAAPGGSIPYDESSIKCGIEENIARTFYAPYVNMKKGLSVQIALLPSIISYLQKTFCKIIVNNNHIKAVRVVELKGNNVVIKDNIIINRSVESLIILNMPLLIKKSNIVVDMNKWTVEYDNIICKIRSMEGKMTCCKPELFTAGNAQCIQVTIANPIVGKEYCLQHIWHPKQ